MGVALKIMVNYCNYLFRGRSNVLIHHTFLNPPPPPPLRRNKRSVHNFADISNFESARTEMKQNRFIIIRKCDIAKCGPPKINKKQKRNEK